MLHPDASSQSSCSRPVLGGKGEGASFRGLATWDEQGEEVTGQAEVAPVLEKNILMHFIWRLSAYFLLFLSHIVTKFCAYILEYFFILLINDSAELLIEISWIWNQILVGKTRLLKIDQVYCISFWLTVQTWL